MPARREEAREERFAKSQQKFFFSQTHKKAVYVLNNQNFILHLVNISGF